MKNQGKNFFVVEKRNFLYIKMSLLNRLFGWKSEKNKKVWIGFFIVFFLISFVVAELITSEVGVQYDSEISDAFQKNQSWVRVLVRLEDNSGLSDTSINEKNEWFKPVIDNVINSFSDEELNVDDFRSDGFEGWVTKEGFDKLIKDNRIRAIISSPENSGARAMEGNISGETQGIQEERSLLWLWIVIGIIIVGVIFFIIFYLKNRR